MKKLLFTYLAFCSSFFYSQENIAKCFAWITPSYFPIQIQREYNFESKNVVYEFKNGQYYKSKFPICISEILFNENGEISAYKFDFKNSFFFGRANVFKLKDSVENLNRYKNFSSDSLTLYNIWGQQIQKRRSKDYDNSVKIILEKKYGSKIAEKIMNGDVWIGMTKQMLKDSKGEPTRVGLTTETKSTYSVQYIYESKIFGTEYIYIENGKVIAIQTL